jgi:Zn-dependent peptidase ImmA (M78 family)
MLWDSEAGIILIEERDRPTRQRFTEAHELMEMLFAVTPARRDAHGRNVGNFPHWTKERLCDAGAAELLMPAATFLPRVRQLGVSFDTARALAVEYEVSLAASLIRMATIGPGRHAVVLWRMKNKPSEIKSQVPENQLALIELPPARISRQKLRVQWSFTGDESLFIPKDKSVADDSLVHAAWLDHYFTVGTDHLNLGTVRGVTYSENQPFEAEEDWQVISLLHLPGDVGCGRPS